VYVGLANSDDLETYRSSKQRWEHISKIREHYGYIMKLNRQSCPLF